MAPIPVLPKPILKTPHLGVYDAIIRNYIGSDTDLTNRDPLWYYATIINFDTCPAIILPYLAKMFGVDGYKGFNFATTEASQRQTLKDAILKKLRHGTGWSIITALENAGYLFVVLNERVGPVYYANGQHIANGGIQANSVHWAMFSIEMQPPVGILPQNVNIPDLMQLINYWKPGRDLCVSVTINQLVITTFNIGSNSYIADGSEIADGSTQATG